MDCCNYMQYRHPYYGSHFYDNGLYNGRDFYGHPYQGYYSPNSQYYQQWSCVAPFSGTYIAKSKTLNNTLRQCYCSSKPPAIKTSCMRMTINF